MNLSLKVLAPSIVGLAGWLITWVSTGNFDGAALYILVSTAVYTIIGISVPPAPGVTQHEVSALSRRRR